MTADPAHFSSLAVGAAQAGGGGAFGGGGSGGGDGGAPIELLFWLLRLAIHYPLIGVPLIVGTVVVFTIGARRGWWRHQERVIRNARPLREAHAVEASLEALRSADPSFDPGAFVARVEVAFRKAQSAWCAQELEPLRPFVSDGVYERFTLQIAEQREAGWRQGMDGLRVERPVLQHVEIGRHFETATLRIRFGADIHRLDLKTGAHVAGSRLPRTWFEECWSFVRRRGARTGVKAGLIEGQCPNCGASLALNQSAKCASCAALVRSGEFDWVLTEITQSSEWRPEDEQSAPGLEEYVRRDPGISVQLLEDRVSVAFWRWSDAARMRRTDPLERVATAEFCERERARFAEARPGGPRLHLGERAVGAVRTRGLIPGEPSDRAVVEVTWDGRFVTVAPDGKRTLDEHRSLRRTLFVLHRRAGETSVLAETFTTSYCPNCGAHDSGGTAPRCPYCGAPRHAGSASWLVAQVVEHPSPEYAALLRECEAQRRPSPPRVGARAPYASTGSSTSRTESLAAPAVGAPPARAGLLAWAVAAARSDGEVDEAERRAIATLAERLGDAPEHVVALLGRAPEELASPSPRDRGEALAWLEQLCELAMADGAVPRSEQQFLRHAARAFGASERELAEAYDRARTRLYRASRTARDAH